MQDDAPARYRMTRTEYLAFEERQTDRKHEWIDGEAIEMSGGTDEHDDIANNLRALLWIGLRGRSPKTKGPDIRVRIPDGPYYYPDVAVAPDPARFERHPSDKKLTLLDPVLVAEVLLDLTAETDTTRKPADYHAIPTVADHLVLVQDRAEVTHHRRDGDGRHTRVLRGTGATLTLPGLGVSLSLRDVYERVVTD